MSTHTSAAIGTEFRPASATAVAALSEALDRVHLPGSARYAELTVTSNVVKAVRPLAVVEVTGPADVSLTLRIAASAGVQVAVAGTGHGATETIADVRQVTHRAGEMSVEDLRGQ